MTILTWLVHARSPLSVEAMQHALATSEATYDAERVVPQLQLLSVCHGLVTLAPSTVAVFENGRPTMREVKVLRLIRKCL
jgi:hypothetical protein